MLVGGLVSQTLTILGGRFRGGVLHDEFRERAVTKISSLFLFPSSLFFAEET
jgi:hypothetical protein